MNNAPQDPEPGKGCMDYVKDFWAKIPFYNRFLLAFLPIVYLLCWVYPLDEKAQNSYIQTVDHMEVWRIFTAPYVHPMLLLLFFVLLAYIPSGSIREKAIGTVKIIVEFTIMNMIIQLLFLGVTYLLKYVTDYWSYFVSIGIWPIIIAEIVIDCNRVPGNFFLQTFRSR
ncbi:unnamed protein product [Moneuplotes crassus]|uniref:Uncharacterized protein n=1 Tax=Euplotes crassus TaxID=5936 RepID=A0AAD1XNA9_EUPCR|nr:unnamed protein product [Moneuplotes crassus]